MHPAIVPTDRGHTFYWNVDGAVGVNGVNAFDDVMFVQWCFYKLGQWNEIAPDLRAVFRDTPLDGRCRGRDGDGLITSIKALQRSQHGLMVDGRVSPPAKGAHYSYRGDHHTFLIFYLNAVLRALHSAQYPRIDLMPEFVWRLKDKATQPFI